MAVSIFAKFPSGITGEAKQAGHEDEVVVQSVSWAVGRAISLTGGSRDTGVATFSDVSITKEADSASSDLAVACAKATPLDEIVITFVKDAGDDQIDYITYTLSNCLISSYTVSAGAGNPIESVSIAYNKIKALYKKQADDHSSASDHEFEYDLLARV
jgi:type VI secretion system secreted protein Hcp